MRTLLPVFGPVVLKAGSRPAASSLRRERRHLAGTPACFLSEFAPRGGGFTAPHLGLMRPFGSGLAQPSPSRHPSPSGLRFGS